MKKLQFLILICILTFTVSCGQQKRYVSYKVKAGETMRDIANRLDMKTKDLLRLNPDTGRRPDVNTVIVIPNPEIKNGTSSSEVTSTNTIPSGEEITNSEESLENTANNTTETPVFKQTVYEYETHTVQAGETVYRITTQYAITKDDLIKWNPEFPGIERNILSIGQVLKVKSIEKTITIDRKEVLKNFLTHTVKSKETVYSLTRFYNISKDDLIRLNPEYPGIINNELSINQLLKIKPILMSNQPAPSLPLNAKVFYPTVIFLSLTIAYSVYNNPSFMAIANAANIWILQNLGRLSVGYRVKDFIHFNLIFPSLFTWGGLIIFGGSSLAIDLQTNGHLDHARLVDVAGIDLNASIFAINAQEVTEKLRALPEVIDCEVERRLPGTLKVTIIERVPAVWLECVDLGYPGRKDGGILADAGGITFPCEGNLWNSSRDLPVIVVSDAEADSFVHGSKMKHPEVMRALHLISTFEINKVRAQWQAERVILVNDYSMVAVCNDGTRAIFGMYDHERQMADFVTICEHSFKTRRAIRHVNLIPKKNIPVKFAGDAVLVKPRRKPAPVDPDVREIESILERN